MGRLSERDETEYDTSPSKARPIPSDHRVGAVRQVVVMPAVAQSTNVVRRWPGGPGRTVGPVRTSATRLFRPPSGPRSGDVPSGVGESAFGETAKPDRAGIT